jgi:hypothetical protein
VYYTLPFKQWGLRCNGARRTCEIKLRIAMTKAAFNKKDTGLKFKEEASKEHSIL